MVGFVRCGLQATACIGGPLSDIAVSESNSIMCCFIGVILPDPSYHSKLEGLFKARERRLALRENLSLRKQLKRDEVFYITTWEECDCSTGLGYKSHLDNVDDNKLHNEEVEKLRRKGWSEAKIERSLGASKEKRTHNQIDRGEKKIADLNRWKILLSDCLLNAHLPYICLFMRQYSGNIDEEEIEIQERKRVKLYSLTLDRLSELKDDVIYEFYNK